VARKNPIFFPQEEWSPSPSRGDGGAVGRALLEVAGKCLVLTGLGSRVRACGDGAERRLHRACAMPRRRSKKMGWIDVWFSLFFCQKGGADKFSFWAKRDISREFARADMF
jgi:hypothetical protein